MPEWASWAVLRLGKPLQPRHLAWVIWKVCVEGPMV